MAHARLHVICGNCGSNEHMSYTIVHNFHDYGFHKEDGVVLACNNCGTDHDLSDTVEDRGRE